MKRNIKVYILILNGIPKIIPFIKEKQEQKAK